MTNKHGTILATRELSFCYGKLEVWSSLNLSVEAGEIVFLLGQNGSGKSTLLRCLAGQSYPSSGEISLCGESFSGKKRRQRSKISFVSDTPSFYDDLTAEEHLRFVLGAQGRGDEYSQAEELIEAFGLSRYIHQYPSSFSRGMREKLALVITFTTNASLYLFDEPYGPLDFDASLMLSSLIKERASRGASVVLSCHHAIPNLQPDKVWVLQDGILGEGDKSILDEMWSKDSCVST